MRTRGLNRHAVIGVAATILVACGGAQGSIGTPLSSAATGLSAVRAQSGKYGVLYSFKGGYKDGSLPVAGLTNVNGRLYGTSERGGAYGYGTVFSLTRAGKEKVIHSFAGDVIGHHDGAGPRARLINVDGTFYGTTYAGGKYRDGTVFSVRPSGAETVLHSFGDHGDGGHPLASLLNVNGTLYGTTSQGGFGCYRSSSSGCGNGVVFAVTLSGRETVIHSFTGSEDGAFPDSKIIDVNGTLYGTTPDGPGSGICGTVFSIAPSGNESVLLNISDGCSPTAGLINVNGALYGTTFMGGPYNDGTVFSVTLSGAENVIYSFGAHPYDGDAPRAGLINVKGTLYGTTDLGGAYSAGSDGGTVFSVTPSGAEIVLHSFGASGDGLGPEAPLINVKSTLYGTTILGGANGEGTVYWLSP